MATYGVVHTSFDLEQSCRPTEALVAFFVAHMIELIARDCQPRRSSKVMLNLHELFDPRV